SNGPDERTVRCRRDLRNALEQLDVPWQTVEFVVRDHCRVRKRTRLIVRAPVNALVEIRLNQLWRLLERRAQLFLRGRQDLDPVVTPEISSVDEQLEPAPRRLELLESRVMHDVIQLAADLLIELRDQAIDQRLVDRLNLASRRDLVEEHFQSGGD